MIQGTGNTTPDNPAEVLNGFQSANEPLVMTESFSTKYVGHGPTYLWGPAGSNNGAWNEAQYS